MSERLRVVVVGNGMVGHHFVEKLIQDKAVPALDVAESRLGAALWFADSFHAAQTERVRQYNNGVGKQNSQWFKDLVGDGPRKAPRRASPPPRPVASSPSAQDRQGSPRFARRLRRP